MTGNFENCFISEFDLQVRVSRIPVTVGSLFLSVPLCYQECAIYNQPGLKHIILYTVGANAVFYSSLGHLKKGGCPFHPVTVTVTSDSDDYFI